MEHLCPTCGDRHEGEPQPAVYEYRCNSCGALNGPVIGDVSLQSCRKCGKAGQLVSLDDIPDAARRYEGLTKTDRGYVVRTSAPVA